MRTITESEAAKLIAAGKAIRHKRMRTRLCIGGAEYRRIVPDPAPGIITKA